MKYKIQGRTTKPKEHKSIIGAVHNYTVKYQLVLRNATDCALPLEIKGLHYVQLSSPPLSCPISKEEMRKEPQLLGGLSLEMIFFLLRGACGKFMVDKRSTGIGSSSGSSYAEEW